MTVADTTGISGLLKDPSVMKALSDAIPNILGGNTMTDSTGLGGGALGAVLVGALLPRLFNNDNGAATAAAAAHVLTAADVNTAITTALNGQTLGSVQGEIWKAEGQVQSSISAAQNAGQLATLNAEIANLQGQGSILADINRISTDSATQNAAIVAAINTTGWEAVNATTTAAANVIASATANTASLLATTNALATQAANNAAAASLGVLQAKYDTLIAIGNDGDKTRAMIEGINNAALNRQIIVADNRIAELLGDRNTAKGGIEINTSVNQAVAQSQAQQQAITTNGLLTQLLTSVQHNTQSTVNLGTMIGSGQTATNVKS